MTSATHMHSVPAVVKADPCATASALPHPRLRPYVVGYSCFSSAQAVRHRVLPLNLVVLIVDLSGASRLVTGPRTVATTEGETTWWHGVSIGLTPAGVLALLGVPMPELVEGSVRLADVLGSRREAELAERLAAAPGWADRFAVLDDELCRWLPAEPHHDRLLLRAWHRLQQPTGRMRVADIADELSVSKRYLQTRFQREIGLGPKTVARIARFQRSVFLLAQHESLLTIASDCGYADQAHFQRDVRAMAGLTPTKLCAFLQYREFAVR
ncbi:helix-turn-helix transcriptional regulator [Allorhizocola rhizosphaerae]|uniref:helix-turn-helix transcriptional regulator n=1 Tax=Allorhizocola rhizosphaerae TaxID=1872709 RepID=UPI000E3E02C5|nr:helix-turn-helix transcriptional regulator [Allorhizocola rhizosphaerae]